MVLNSFVTAGGSGLTRRLATYLTGSVFQPFIVIVDPIVSIGFSVWTYGETLTPQNHRPRSELAGVLRDVCRGNCAGT